MRAAVPWLAAAVAAATIAVGAIARATGTRLGTHAPPFVGGWGVQAEALPLLVAVLVFAGAVLLVPRLLDGRVPPVAFAAALLLGGLALRLSLNAVRLGPAGWTEVFTTSFEAGNEYLPALPAFAYGTGFFLDRFAEIIPALPVHPSGHPPGLLLLMHSLGIDTADRLAAVLIATGALLGPLTYALGRTRLDERGARVCGLLGTLAPGVLLFGATSADALYATAGALAAWPLAARSWRARAGGAAILAVVALFAWSLLGIGAWAVLLCWLREGFRRAVVLGLLCAVALLAVQGALAAATGFDPIGAVHATGTVYRLGVASRRPYWFWLFGSPVAFLVVLGLPVTWLALRRLAAGAPEAVAIFAILVVSSLLGFTKAETERIWLFYAPLVCLAATPAVRRPTLVMALLAAQGIVYEVVANTVW